MIGWIMNEATGEIPAQRVISSKGELTGGWAFGGKDKMRQLLEAEGIIFLADERVDLKQYGWDPSRDLSPAESDHILSDAASVPVAVSPRLLQLLSSDPASPLRVS
jgi:methylated-DNA-protein-cysteine methyltransferase-like protein